MSSSKSTFNPNALSYSRDEVLPLIVKLTSRNIDYAINQLFPGTYRNIPAGVSCDHSLFINLCPRNANFWFCARAFKKDDVEQPIMSPFNAADEMVRRGASVIVKAPVLADNADKKEKRVEDESMEDGYSGSIVFTLNGKDIECRCYRGYPDPTPLGGVVAGAKVAKFRAGLITVVQFFGSIATMANGKIKISDLQQPNKVIGFNYLFKDVKDGPLTFQPLLDSIFAEGPTPPEGWKGVSLTGQAFMHALYMCFTTQKANTVIQTFSTMNLVMNGALGDPSRPKAVNMKKIDGAMKFEMGLNYPKFPPTLSEEPFSANPKGPCIATEMQAWETRNITGAFRGLDKGEKSGVARSAYCEFNINPGWAEVMYHVAELKRLHLPDSLFIAFDPNATVKIFQVLSALKVMEYKGVVHAEYCNAFGNICRPLDEDQTEYILKDAKYKIKILSMDAMDEVKIDLIIDHRETVHKVQKVAAAIAQYPRSVSAHIKKMNRYEIPYVFFAPICSLALEGVTCHSCVRFHNGIMLYAKDWKLDGEKWWYDVSSPDMLKQQCWRMVMINLLRCHAGLTGRPLAEFAKRFKIKMPLLEIYILRGMTKVDVMYESIFEDALISSFTMSDKSGKKNKKTAHQKADEEDDVDDDEEEVKEDDGFESFNPDDEV
jgi:hypothetical protein